MIRVLITGDADPEPHLARLGRWQSIEVVDTTDLSQVDLVLALPGDKNAATLDRARRAGVRIAEVVG